MKNENMKTENVRLQGFRGTWYVIGKYQGTGTLYLLWESEQHGDERPAILTDQNLRVIDSCCYSGIYVALQDNGLII